MNIRYPTINWFVVSLLLVIAVARFFPGPASYQGPVTLHQLGDAGIILVFFFYGLKLNPSVLKKDLGNWKLHLLVQSSTFVLFPVLVLPFVLAFGDNNGQLLWLGAFFLATLPSTVSSSVVMVSIARGNVPGAIFNASLSSLLGIIVTPLWMGIFISAAPGQNTELTGMITKLVLQVLLPVITGMMLGKFFRASVGSKARFFKLFDQSVILLIVYLSFAQTFTNNLFSTVGTIDLLLVALFCITLFLLVYFLILYACKKLRFNTEDTITAQFAGSKKSLVHGTVMASVLFQNISVVGVILLPLMTYHLIQLLVIGYIAKEKGKRL